MSQQPPLFPTYSPGVMSILPLLYVGWADSVLSPSEVKLIEKKINDAHFLTDADRATIKEWSNPAHPPSNDKFKHWVSLLKKTAAQLPCEKRQSLSNLGIEMAKRTATGSESLQWNSEETKTALEELEEALGCGSLETFRNIFSQEQREKEVSEIINQPSFDIEKMTALLDDDYAEIRNRMRTLLKDPVFEYKTLRNKEEYRNQVMDWCKMLADQGFGAMAYPKEYGGSGDMGAYIAIFEMLGYHDLSLAIKFGVQFGLFGGSVANLGTERHHKKYLNDTGTLKLAGIKLD